MFGMGKLWDSVRGFFTAQFEAVWSGFRTLLRSALTDISQDPFLQLFNISKDEWDIILWHFVSQGLIDEKTKEEIKKQYDFLPPFDVVTYLFLLFVLNFQYLAAQSSVVSRDMLHNLNAEYANMHPMPQDVIGGAFIAPEKTSEIRQLMLEQGFSEDKIDLFFLALYRTVPENVLQPLYLRGNIDEEQLYTRMRELGYTDTRISEIVQTWEQRPAVTDLVRFAYRALFSEETKQKWPWMYKAPQGFVDEAAKSGLSDYWASMYWAAHWQQPGLMQTFEMLHRDKIAEDDVRYALEAQGFSEYWRDKLLSISYSPYTRVDTRRMHDMGILDTEGVFEAYLAQGYDEERAKNMTRFTLRYNQEHHRDLTRSQIEKAYKGHLIEGQEAAGLLKEIGYQEAEANFLLEYWDWERNQEYEERQLENIGSRYKKNLIDSGEARARLGRLNLDATRVDVLLDEWSLDKEEDIKTPSKSDLDKFFKNDIIDRETYRYEMQRLGYGAMYIDWYMQLSDIKKPR